MAIFVLPGTLQDGLNKSKLSWQILYVASTWGSEPEISLINILVSAVWPLELSTFTMMWCERIRRDNKERSCEGHSRLPIHASFCRRSADRSRKTVPAGAFVRMGCWRYYNFSILR